MSDKQPNLPKNISRTLAGMVRRLENKLGVPVVISVTVHDSQKPQTTVFGGFADRKIRVEIFDSYKDIDHNTLKTINVPVDYGYRRLEGEYKNLEAFREKLEELIRIDLRKAGIPTRKIRRGKFLGFRCPKCREWRGRAKGYGENAILGVFSTVCQNCGEAISMPDIGFVQVEGDERTGYNIYISDFGGCRSTLSHIGHIHFAYDGGEFNVSVDKRE